MTAAFPLLAACLAQVPAVPAGQAEVEEALARAAEELERGAPQRAHALLDSLARAPETAALDARVRVRLDALLGIAAEAVGDLDTAALHLESAVVRGGLEPPELASESRWAWVRSALAMKDGATALVALERLTAVEQGTPQAGEMRALSLFHQGRLQAAEEALLAVLTRGPSPQASFYLGVILFDRGDYRAALPRFDACLAGEPRNHYALVYRVRARLELGDLDGAEESLTPLLAGDSGSLPEPQYLLGKLRLRQGRAAEASASLRRALELQPAYGEALFSLGAALRKEGKEAEAREVLERFAALHREEAKRLRRADALSQAALRSSSDAAVLEEAAGFFLATGDPSAAETHAWRAVRLDPGRSGARLTLARALKAGGQNGAAAVQYRKIILADRDNVAANRELEELIRRHGRPAR